jgi:predicted porin
MKKSLFAIAAVTAFAGAAQAQSSVTVYGNQMGDVIYDRRGNGADYTNSGMSTNDSYTVRSTNALVLKSERMSGFGIKGMLVAAGRTANQVSATSGGESSNEGYGVGVDYQWKKLYVTANYQAFRNNTSSGAATVDATSVTPGLAAQGTTFTPGYNAGIVTPGINSQDAQQYYAATYDFGILKAFVGYVNRKASNVNNSNNYVSRTAQQIGVRAPITPAVQVWASAGTGKINSQGSSGSSANITGWQIGSDYNLSKRTNLYAIYGISATSNAQIGTYANSTVPSTQTSYNQSSYAVGVRHTF